MNPQLAFIAGPNGAGKSTFYDEFLSRLRLPFVNADVFEGRTAVTSVEAARILDIVRDNLIDRRAGFVTETVFSDPFGVKLGLLRKAVGAEYDVTLIYIGIDPKLCPFRVDQRVAAGGHDVPRDRLASRFKRSLVNLRSAIQFVPLVKIYDNSLIDDPFRLIAIFDHGQRSFLASPLPHWARGIAV